MNSLTKNTPWLKVIALVGILSAASLSARAADREDVVAGVIIGTAAGYILSEHGANIHIGYRRGDYGHHHHTRYCEHDRHHAKFDRHYRDYRHGHKHYHGSKHHRDDRYYGNRGRHGDNRDYRGYNSHRPVASKPQRHQDYSHKSKREVSSRY